MAAQPRLTHFTVLCNTVVLARSPCVLALLGLEIYVNKLCTATLLLHKEPQPSCWATPRLLISGHHRHVLSAQHHYPMPDTPRSGEHVGALRAAHDQPQPLELQQDLQQRRLLAVHQVQRLQLLLGHACTRRHSARRTSLRVAQKQRSACG